MALALKTREAYMAHRWVPYTINWRIIIKTTNTPATRTHMGVASYAMSPRKEAREIEETSVHKVGMREEREKKTYESYTSRER